MFFLIEVRRLKTSSSSLASTWYYSITSRRTKSQKTRTKQISNQKLKIRNSKGYTMI